MVLPKIRNKCPSFLAVISSVNVFIFFVFTLKILSNSCRLRDGVIPSKPVSRYKSFEISERNHYAELMQNEREAKLFGLTGKSSGNSPETHFRVPGSSLKADIAPNLKLPSLQREQQSTKRETSHATSLPFNPETTRNKFVTTTPEVLRRSVTSYSLLNHSVTNFADNRKLSYLQKPVAKETRTLEALASDDVHQMEFKKIINTAFTTGQGEQPTDVPMKSSNSRSVAHENNVGTSPAAIALDTKAALQDWPFNSSTNRFTMNSTVHPEVQTFLMKLATGESLTACVEPCLGLVNVYLWYGIFDKFYVRVLHYNDMFPRFPQGAYFNRHIWEENVHIGDELKDTGRRFTGYFTPDRSGEYQFLLESRDGSEFILVRNDTIGSGQYVSNFLFRITISHSDVMEQNDKISDLELFKKESPSVYLEKGVAYLVDVCHILGTWGALRLSYKPPGEHNFVKLHRHLLRPLFSHTSLRVILPPIFYMNLETPEYRHIVSHKRTTFHNFPVLNVSSVGQSCSYRPSYVMKADFQRNVTGFEWVLAKYDLQYPIDPMINNSDNMADVYMNTDRAEGVVKAYLDVIIRPNFRNISLQDVVHIEENREDDKIAKRYFVELDLTDSHIQRTYRTSQYIVVNADGKLCIPEGYSWSPAEKIYLLTILLNQEIWVRQLVYRLSEIAAETGDLNLHLIVVDYNSTDANVKMILETLPFNFSIIQLSGPFNKVHGLNVAASQVPGDHLMFILDLHLRLPNYIFDQVRKHTFRGLTVYCPILRRLFGSQHPAYSNMTWLSLWMEQGFGMISMFKSDWDRIGGMDEIKFGTKWGGEDWDIAGRIVVRGLELIHHRWPGYWHIVHKTKGTWDGTKLDV